MIDPAVAQQGREVRDTYERSIHQAGRNRRMKLAEGTYHFTASIVYGIRLYINGVKLINKWFPQASSAYSADIYLPACAHDLVLGHFEMGGQAVAKLNSAAIW